jgi:hypothetical protein
MRTKVTSRSLSFIVPLLRTREIYGASPTNVLSVLKKRLVLAEPLYKEARQCARKNTE